MLLVAFGAGAFGWLERQDEDGNEEDRGKKVKIAAAIGLAALIAALVAWLLRPSLAESENRLQDLLREEMTADDTGTLPQPKASNGALTCTFQPERSRVTGAVAQTVPFEWSADGCVNGRTQYGADGGAWSRVFVPGDEESVSVNRFDPATGEYRMDRYLLGREDMAAARTARAEYEAPACGTGPDAGRELGWRQQAIISLLPPQPNERLVYRCTEAATE